MKQYKEIVLGAKAREYIRYHLTNGRTLAKYILENLNLEIGQVLTGLPKEANLENVENPDACWIIPKAPESEWLRYGANKGRPSIAIPVHTFYSYLVNTIRAFLQVRPERICMFEDLDSSPTDPWLKSRKTRIVTFRDEVYHFLTGGQHSADEIEMVIRESENAWRLVGAMASLPDDKHTFSDGQEITSDVLKMLAARTERIFVTAYDGEAYIIWHRKPI